MGRSPHPWYRTSVDAWYVTIHGSQVRLANGAKSRDEAYAAFYRIMAKDEAAKRIQETFPLCALADMFLDAIKKASEPATFDYFLRFLKGTETNPGFVVFAGIHTASASIKPGHVTQWLDSKSWGNSTRSLAIRTVKRMFNWAFESGYLEASPIAALKLPRSLIREDVLTNVQADAIFSRCQDRQFRDLLTALRETGCRPKEIWTLTAAGVSLDDRTWRVINKTRKKTGLTHRTVYLTDTMVELSKRLAEKHPEGPIFRNTLGRPWRKKSINHRFMRLREKMAYGPECVAYAYRHLYITDALERGVPPATLAELVGHTDMKMIMRVYNKLKHRTEHLREAAKSARSTSVVGRPAE